MSGISIGAGVGSGMSANVVVGAARTDIARPRNFYDVEAWRGVRVIRRFMRKHLDYSRAWLLWRENFENLVTTAGKNYLLDAGLVSGVASPVWYIGLKNTGTVAAGDTMGSHAGWTENVTYSQATRPAWTPGSVASGSVDNSASKASFTINGTTTIYGCFQTTVNTKSGTTGTLYGAGDFSSSRALESTDVINVQVTDSLT